LWAAEAALQTEHRVIETGPYHYARHPIYTGAIAIGVGAALVFATWWTWAAAAVYTAAYVRKAYLEDHFLAAQLPGYDGYRRRTRYLFFPHIW
jgi:protein-S-isoprenylcysteine O-methyltransferase Ste14